ncbi:MAG TPA: glycoside hydrolase family 3 N-terminal domain-containing protein [Propionibacteriaceae bacterium]|nr:glycoside hydrolase family 3 N-terminal domain-containing protein [Propionibacteriaceae bacterium]HQE30845.1 glycoside hydrolase family 3 N-terminal domain-containing protein [Propionibacteriaceae bacterium]
MSALREPSTGSRRRRAAVATILTGLLAACATTPIAAPTPTLSSGTGAATTSAGASVTAAPSPVASPTATPEQSASPGADACLRAAAALPLQKQVGQLFMVAIQPGTSPQRVVSTGAGSIILLGDWSGRAPTATQVEAMTRAVPGLLVATDQEGGQVQRLKGTGFDTIPNAVAQAAMGDAALASAADKWGTQLWAAGVRYNLAPVADVVPAAKTSSNQPIGALKRGYGSDPAVVSARVSAFVTGMEGASIATSLKHFPGLGEVTGNTDFTSATDAVTTRTSPSLAAFKAGIEAGASSVMVSSAVYSKIDPGVPAVFSPVIVTDMLRGDLGFTGVVISDDLGAAKSVSGVAPADRAVRFFAAGGDLLINADLAIQPAMNDAVVKRATTDPAFAKQVTQSAARVLALKESVGLSVCS